MQQGSDLLSSSVRQTEMKQESCSVHVQASGGRSLVHNMTAHEAKAHSAVCSNACVTMRCLATLLILQVGRADFEVPCSWVMAWVNALAILARQPKKPPTLHVDTLAGAAGVHCHSRVHPAAGRGHRQAH